MHFTNKSFIGAIEPNLLPITRLAKGMVIVLCLLLLSNTQHDIVRSRRRLTKGMGNEALEHLKELRSNSVGREFTIQIPKDENGKFIPYEEFIKLDQAEQKRVNDLVEKHCNEYYAIVAEISQETHSLHEYLKDFVERSGDLCLGIHVARFRQAGMTIADQGNYLSRILRGEALIKSIYKSEKDMQTAAGSGTIRFMKALDTHDKTMQHCQFASSKTLEILKTYFEKYGNGLDHPDITHLYECNKTLLKGILEKTDAWKLYRFESGEATDMKLRFALYTFILFILWVTMKCRGCKNHTVAKATVVVLSLMIVFDVTRTEEPKDWKTLDMSDNWVWKKVYGNSGAELS